MRFLPVALLLVVASLLASCGGGGGSGDASTRPTITPNSILISDVLVSLQGQTDRIANIFCRSDFSLCQATYQGQTFQFVPDEDSDVQGAVYQTLGDWNHTRAGAIYANLQGLQARYAAAGGVTYPDSTPRGTAEWNGDMVGLDYNSRVVRGGATITLTDFGDARVDVRLTPHSLPVMEWFNIPVYGGAYSDRQASNNYLKGEFYGPNGEETGGVFERNQIIGAFGAKRGS